MGAYHQEFEGAIYPNKIDKLDRDQISALYLSNSKIDWQGLKSSEGANGWPRGYRYERYLDT